MKKENSSCIKPQIKIERTRQKLASLEGYFKKIPGHFRWNRDEALAYICQAIRYLLFLIEECGINKNNKNDDYRED